MIKLYDADSDVEIGPISEEQLDLLVENLVEEGLDDYSWSIDAGALSVLESGGADAALLTLLRRALGTRTSMAIRYDPD